MARGTAPILGVAFVYQTIIVIDLHEPGWATATGCILRTLTSAGQAQSNRGISFCYLLWLQTLPSQLIPTGVRRMFVSISKLSRRPASASEIFQSTRSMVFATTE
ncbi:hypothetical protein E0H39_26015 [Rhizobium leguminosarum bv. viciae]|uniref:Uncharacterized protein n=2 Tax=Rhizobium leguminosarum TaxID=384 RepID=A0A1C9HV62_RHILT|nr:hypothetical protein [Rhizobium leguminosarum]AOO90570.1 hypothetical protein [Rhizobium leguminosarum bv. trifolii]MBY5474411.1 hypothetical protein [Rhizobium leguminosarum]MBY5509934.1 hypothetical protein [Rhizobium leguminosarum]MBY5516695.1 hypothetical protein [Rhizobium leguminosarum]QIO61687.1 hypothetical protein HA463_28710 [Rhizobium leguminosarum bv. trifolii]